MSNFKKFTPRHRIEKTETRASITINSRRSLGSILFLALGNLLWIYMASGLAVLWWGMFLAATGIMDPEYQGAPLYVMMLCATSVFLIFLLSMGIFILYRFLWELAGKEFIEVNQDKLLVTHQLLGWKRVSEFSNPKIRGLITRNTKQSLFWIPFRKSYRYAFELNHDGQIFRFGNSVKELEATEISSTIQAFISPAS